ncbi:MAG: hypothetical protein ABI850_00030 [Flavobacterium sp.]
MKNIAIFLLSAVLLSACKQEKSKTSDDGTKVLSTTKNLSFKVNKIDTTNLPAALKYEGNIKNAVRWQDNAGDNIVITTETGHYINPKFKHENEDSSDAELFAYHYIISGDEVKQTWKVYDYISDCPVEIAAYFVKNTFNVTDLNKNGIAEIWLMYKTTCHGDVSPLQMKVIMYEGKEKYAMRGENKVLLETSEGKEKFIGGEFKFDANFEKAPKIFKEFALNLWNKNIMQKWGDDH